VFVGAALLALMGACIMIGATYRNLFGLLVLGCFLQVRFVSQKRIQPPVNAVVYNQQWCHSGSKTHVLLKNRGHAPT
jgi:hypothetical protein